MANPRQRRKSKSSSHKPVKHSKRAQKLLKKQPPIRGPKVLQEAWDIKKTVRQNYAALGLMHSTKPQIFEITEEVMDTTTASTPPPPEPSTSQNKGELKKGFGRIVRDENGNVLRVELPDDEGESNAKELVEEEEEPWGKPMDDGPRDGRPVASKTDLVRELEKLSSVTIKKSRPASVHEVVYLRKLVQAYGDDIDSMAKDLKRNVWQKTPGELKRAISKAGGFEKLKAQ